MSDKVKFNIKNVHVAPMEEDGNTPKWGNVIKIPGAVTFALDPQGEITPFYADGIVYYQSQANNGYTGDLEAALFPAEFLKAIFQIQEGEESKVLTENSNKEIKPFAMMFEEDGDVSGTKFVLYNCMATRPKRTFNTNTNTKTPQTQTISITASPLESGNVMAMTQETTPESVRNNWYKGVYIEGETQTSSTNSQSTGDDGEDAE